MERLSIDFGKKSKLAFSIYPAPQVPNNHKEKQNHPCCCTGVHFHCGTLQRCAVHAHNPGALRLCLPSGQPGHLRPLSEEPWSPDSHLHKLEQNHRPGSLLCHGLIEVRSGFDKEIWLILNASRFDGALNVDLNEFQTNLVRATISTDVESNTNSRFLILVFISPL